MLRSNSKSLGNSVVNKPFIGFWQPRKTGLKVLVSSEEEKERLQWKGFAE